MSNWVLINKDNKVVDTSAEESGCFEVFEGSPEFLRWVTTITESASIGQFFKPEDQSVYCWHTEQSNTEEGIAHKFAVDRKVAYGDLGDQLDMLYKDMTSDTTTWIDHITKVKSEVTK